MSLPRWWQIGGRSGPNRVPFPLGQNAGTFKVCTWNCRGLFIGDPVNRALCFNFLRKLPLKSHILCFQETHGLPFEVFTELGSLPPGWRALHSACLDVHGISNGAAGGVAILICPNIANVCDLKHTVLYPGRVHKVSFEFCVGQSVPPSDVPIFPDRCFEVVNIHN